MELKEIIAELEKFKGQDEYENYISGLITADRVNKFIDTDEGKKILQPKIDSNFTKGLETWKSNNLEKLVSEKVKELYPEQDPKDLEIKKVMQELENMKREATRKDLTNKAMKLATQKNLPVDLIDYFIGDDEEVTTKNLETFEKIFNSSLSAGIDSKIKDNTYIPPNGKTEELSGVEKAFYDINKNLK